MGAIRLLFLCVAFFFISRVAHDQMLHDQHEEILIQEAEDDIHNHPHQHQHLKDSEHDKIVTLAMH